MQNFLIFIFNEYILAYIIGSFLFSSVSVFFIYKLFYLTTTLNINYINSYKVNRQISKLEMMIDSDNFEKNEIEMLKYNLKIQNYQKLLNINESSLINLICLSTYDDVRSAVFLFKRGKKHISLNDTLFKYELIPMIKNDLKKSKKEKNNNYFTIRFLTTSISLTLFMIYFLTINKNFQYDYFYYSFLFTICTIFTFIFTTEYYIYDQDSYLAAQNLSNLKKSKNIELMIDSINI